MTLLSCVCVRITRCVLELELGAASSDFGVFEIV